jgi:glycosyl transferase family 25
LRVRGVGDRTVECWDNAAPFPWHARTFRMTFPEDDTVRRSRAPGLAPGLDGIFVVHAKSLTDRRASIERQLGALGLPFDFVLDYDVGDIPDALRQRLIRTDTLRPAQESCALKHWRAHQLMVERGLQRVLVLEDDVILSDHFLDALGKALAEDDRIPGPHVTFLGCGGHYYVPRDQLRAGQLLYRRDQGKFGDSYLVNLGAARRRLETIEREGIALPIDHVFETADRAAGTPMYWLEPPIVEQGSHNGQFGSALERSHPLWFQSLQFRWKKFWRRKKHPKTGAST